MVITASGLQTSWNPVETYNHPRERFGAPPTSQFHALTKGLLGESFPHRNHKEHTIYFKSFIADRAVITKQE